MALRIATQTLLLGGAVVAVIMGMQYQTVIKKADQYDPDTENSLAQLYLIDTQIVKYNEDGLPDQVINAPTSVQRSHSNSAEILKPTLLLFKDGQLVWTINAENGRIDREQHLIALQNQVKLIETENQSTLTTDELNFDTLNQIALSNSNVDVVSKNATISANRLEFRLNDGKYTLSKRVIANYANQP